MFLDHVVPPFAARISRVVADVQALGGDKWERLKAGGKQWQTTPKNCPECSVPEPYRSHDWALVPASPASKAEY